MKLSRKITLPLAAGTVIAVAAVAGCTNTSGQAKENQAQQQDSQSLVTDQPIPHLRRTARGGWSRKPPRVAARIRRFRLGQ